MLQDSHPRSSRGVSGDDPEGGARSGVLRRRLVTVRSGRPGTPPARHYDLAARSSLHGSGRQLPAVVGRRAPKETEARPRGPKPPRWSAERRASRVMGRKAPRKRLAYRVMIRPTGVPPSTRTFLGAPPTPRFGVGEAKVQTPGAEMRCGKEGYCAECGETKWSDKTGVVPVMRGLDPRIHLLRKLFLRRWMDCRVKPGNDGGWARGDGGWARGRAARFQVKMLPPNRKAQMATAATMEPTIPSHSLQAVVSGIS